MEGSTSVGFEPVRLLELELGVHVMDDCLAHTSPGSEAAAG
jgi:hypothetical protein